VQMLPYPAVQMLRSVAVGHDEPMGVSYHDADGP
jgi:hypothetical protein